MVLPVLVKRLEELIRRFDRLDKKLSGLTGEFREARGITDEQLRQIEQRMLSGQELVFDPRRLDKPVRIVSAFRWHFDAEAISKSMLLFRTETGQNAVLSDRGLCFGPRTVSSKELETDHRFDGILPAEVNPRPRGAKAWNYKLTFGNKFELRVQGHDIGGRFTYRAQLRRKVSK